MSGTLVDAKEPTAPVKDEVAQANAIEARGLGRRFGKKWVVRGLDLSVPEGSVTALLGRNGIGKSTTIQMLLGLLPVTEGKVSILGRDPRREGPRLFTDVAYVSERRELLEDQRVSGLARIVAEAHGKRFDRAGFETLRARYGLDGDARCRNLSKGQRARLLLALAISARPRVLVLDEPTSGLDVVVRDDFLQAIATFASEEGHAVLLSTHAIDDVARICDRVVILREGGLAFAGGVDDAREAVSRYVVRLSGVVPEDVPIPLPRGAIVLEREARALSIVAPGAVERLEAALESVLPVAGIERRPATLKEAFTCLTDEGQVKS